MKATFTRPSHTPNKRIALTHARLFDPETGLDTQGTLLIENGKIADLGSHLGNITADETIDCHGHLLSPGLIDIQVHFREPGQERKETFETGSMAAAAGGVTSVVCMPNTKPVIDDVSTVELVQNRAREKSLIHIYMYAAITKGLAGERLTEMRLLKEAGVVGFTDDGLPVMNAHTMRMALTYANELGIPIAQHAEDLQLSNHGSMNEGAVCSRLGLAGIPNISESIMVARDIRLLESTGGKYHLLHVSTAEALEEIRAAKAKGLNVTCEAAPHHFLLTDEAVGEYRTFCKMNPPLRSEKDRLAILEGLRDGTIDAIATDHAPHDQESKRVPFAQAAFGIIGVETMLPLSLSLYHSGQLSLRDLLAKMTYKAADIISIPAGRLRKGDNADLTLMDINHEWVIETEKLHSKSKNSPFDGFKVKGRTLKTWVKGEQVYQLG